MTTRFATVFLIASMIVGSIPASAKHPDYPDADRVLPPYKALPPEMVQGEHFMVLDPVVNIFNLDHFRVESDFGEFEAVGQMMLRIRLREIDAMARLEEVKKTRIIKKALKTDTKKSVGPVGHVDSSPIESAQGIGQEVSDRFNTSDHDTAKGVDTLKNEDPSSHKAAKLSDRFPGVDESYRDWCRWLGVDPYTSNPVLRDKLLQVAKIDAEEALGSRFKVPTLPGTDFISDAYTAIWSYDPQELLELNRRHLQEIGIPDHLLDAFFEIDALTPSIITSLVGALVELDGVANREIIIEQALPTKTESGANYFLECVAMAAWFHTNEEPLVRMVGGTGIPVGITKSGRLIAFDGSDFPHWSDRMAEIVREFDSTYRPLSDDREFWIAGKAAGSFKSRIGELGWKAVTGVRGKYLPKIPWGMLPNEYNDEDAFE